MVVLNCVDNISQEQQDALKKLGELKNFKEMNLGLFKIIEKCSFGEESNKQCVIDFLDFLNRKEFKDGVIIHLPFVNPVFNEFLLSELSARNIKRVYSQFITLSFSSNVGSTVSKTTKIFEGILVVG